MNKTFHQELKDLIDQYAHMAYSASRDFPKEELYGVTSQLRRQESKYLLEFSCKEGFLIKTNYEQPLSLNDRIGGMLWGIIKRMKVES